MLFLFFACNNNILQTTGELGRINYALETSFSVGNERLDQVKLAVGYPHNISSSLTLEGWKMVETEPYKVYHSSPDSLDIEAESLFDGAVGVPSFTVISSQEGEYLVESHFEDALVDQIHLDFVQPDAVSVLSWIREPTSEEFVLFEGEEIPVLLGSQAAFVPVPEFQGERIVGDLDVEITVVPETAAVVGYNIESVSEDGVSFNSSPASIYFMEEGEVSVLAKDLVNQVETEQKFIVQSQ